ncbi:MAG: DUF106 domain-containing protein [Candidatus Thermoplasmatota archaeon]|nr:DUF106 domain-containing protein [Candidatus Thermoplasmatota archaeon]
MAEKTETAPAANPLQSCQGPSGFIFVIAFAFLFLIMFDRNLGNQISDWVGVVLFPAIGFGGHYPIFTMLAAGFLTITISTVVRHFTMDWIDLAKKQRLMNEYNKTVRAATKAGNQSLVEKLQSENQDIMGMQSTMMMQQMKASIISMVIAILIFRWLYSFIWSIPQATVTVPWDLQWPMTGAALGDVCGSICMNPSGSGIPYWIFVYIPITVPIGQAMMRGLKYFEFSSKLKKRGEEVFGPRRSKTENETAPLTDEGEKDEKRPRVAKGPPKDLKEKADRTGKGRRKKDK